jgi:hypothetical protein
MKMLLKSLAPLGALLAFTLITGCQPTEPDGFTGAADPETTRGERAGEPINPPPPTRGGPAPTTR